MARALINAPKTARRGEIIEIRTLISHPMETGYRPDASGEVIEIRTLISHPMETGYRPGPEGRLLPRDIIGDFSCTYNGVEVFRADLHPAVSANPFLVFTTVATESGTIALTWTGDNGFTQTEIATIEVT